MLDLVIYINLDNRLDRRAEIEAELKRIRVPEEKILRWSATRMRNGIIGCCMSHIAVLEHIQTLPESIQTILVLEDDSEFLQDVDKVKDSLDKFLELPRDSWELALLSYTVLDRENYNDLVSLTLMAQLASAYLVNRKFSHRLLAVWKEGLAKLIETGNVQHYAVDVYWWKIMQDRKSFYFNEALCSQRESYSNLDHVIMKRPSSVEKYDAKRVVSHKC
jgi:glycosyl transferase family 25